MKEHYVSFECAKRLHELGFDGADKYYVTENFCSGNNPISFDTYSVGDLVDEHIVYFVNEDNEDDYRGIPAPRIDQAQAWLRDCKGIHVALNPYLVCHRDADGNIYEERYLWSFELMRVPCGDYKTIADGGDYESYDEALSAGIDKALELLTNKPTAI